MWRWSVRWRSRMSLNTRLLAQRQDRRPDGNQTNMQIYQILISFIIIIIIIMGSCTKYQLTYIHLYTAHHVGGSCFCYSIIISRLMNSVDPSISTTTSIQCSLATSYWKKIVNEKKLHRRPTIEQHNSSEVTRRAVQPGVMMVLRQRGYLWLGRVVGLAVIWRHDFKFIRVFLQLSLNN